MKLKLSLVGIALLATHAFALTAQDVERQIQEIQNLPAQQRVEKMNELKSELRNMNEQERHEIMKEIAEKHHIEHTETESHIRDFQNHNNVMKHQDMEYQNGNHQGLDHQDIEHNDVEHNDVDRPDVEHNDADKNDNDRDRDKGDK